MKRTSAPLIAGILLAAPLLVGAKGCEAVVGNDPEPCGGLTGAACEPNEFCDFAPDAACGAADASGVCRPTPEACTEEYAPVCGCDDRTYGNACAANMAGVSVARQGECDVGSDVCGGLTGARCGAGEFCSYPPGASCGAADATGTCTAMPEECTLEYAPVCGCDDRTYGNACSAHMAGVSVASEGPCGGEQTTCGGLLGLQCAADEFCNFPPDASCGFADATGVCEARPEVCEDVFEPVCGCDGRTYANACEANGAGVSVASEGECGGEGERCGGFTGTVCPSDQFCNFPPDMACGQTDGTGTCEPRPNACDDILDPVCGCDGVTYPNGCEANAAGVSVASEGECESTDPEFCGGIAGFPCPEGEFCNYPPEAMCGAADGPGTCTRIPEACTLEYAPVCGCDGMTYQNACSAQGAAVSVAQQGACP